ncbi:hypothetical protein CSUI_003202 [Cystoisospora suis]|uniref:Macro domain-containing protein n=1 Tax=Cystoisospora suis TaxID=483139 RepID=A0A2C6L6D2_9APIC|nr:hypothetical protein CSUI_003202 [Cystoisospora suis]
MISLPRPSLSSSSSSFRILSPGLFYSSSSSSSPPPSTPSSPSSSFSLVFLRSFSSSHLSRKLRLAHERASKGHIDYLRQLEKPPSSPPYPLPASPSSSSPLSSSVHIRSAFSEESAVHTPEPNVLVRPAEEWIKRDFFFPKSHAPSEAAAGAAAASLDRELRQTFSSSSPSSFSQDSNLYHLLQEQQERGKDRKGGKEKRKEEEEDLDHCRLLPEEPLYGGLVQSMSIPALGEVQVFHGDIFSVKKIKKKEEGKDTPFKRFLKEKEMRVERKEEGEEGEEERKKEDKRSSYIADVLLVPIPPNFLPYRGFSLEVLERGGVSLQRELYTAVKRRLHERLNLLSAPSSSLDQDLSHSHAGADSHSSSSSYREEEEREKQRFHSERKASLGYLPTLDPGEVVLTSTHGVCTDRVRFLAFLVTPYFWQGNSTEAGRRLRYTMNRCLSELNRLGIDTVISPFIGAGGIYGYEPAGGSEILIETSIEHIMQVVAAPVYWSRKQRRLLNVTDDMLFFCRKHTPLSFKKHHGVIRRKRTHYYSNIRPFLWRSSRVLEPPPLQVYRHSGEVAEWQLPARPFYRLGVSSILFPPRRSSFPSMRINAKGQFVGINRMPKIAEKAQPRL